MINQTEGGAIVYYIYIRLTKLDNLITKDNNKINSNSYTVIYLFTFVIVHIKIMIVLP